MFPADFSMTVAFAAFGLTLIGAGIMFALDRIRAALLEILAEMKRQ